MIIKYIHSFFISAVLATIAIIGATGTVSAETKQRIDYSYTSGFDDQFFSSMLTELNVHVNPGAPNIFSVRVLRTLPDGNGGRTQTVFIKEMEQARYWQVYRLLRGVKNIKKKRVVRDELLCDSTPHSVRFNNRTQLVYDVCGDAGNKPRVHAKMLRAITLLDAMTNETVDTPDASYVRRAE